jgi:hypothetical protein
MSAPATSFASGLASKSTLAVTLGPSNSSRTASARADANRLLSLAWHPSGSRVLTTWVHTKGYELSAPMASLGDPDTIDIAHFYLAGPKSQGVSWLNARKPAGSTLSGEGGPDRAHLEWSYSFAFTPLLPDSDLQYSKLILPNGETEFRIDAQVSWTPQKSPFSIIPGGSASLNATFLPGYGQPASGKRMVSTKNLSVIATIRTQINGLPVAYPGPLSCPSELPGSVIVQFFHSHELQAFAVVHFNSSACGFSRVTLYSATHTRIGSGDDGGGYRAVPRLMKLLGIANS